MTSSSLGLDMSEWTQDIQKGECSLKGFLSVIGESIDEQESRKFKEGMDSKLLLYRALCKAVECKAICMGYVMLGECSSLDKELMDLFRSWVDIEEGVPIV